MIEQKRTASLAGIALFLCVALAPAARADQAACLKQKEAEQALDFVKTGDELRSYCAPCDDKGWRKITVSTASVENDGGGCGYSLAVNGEGVDLAYVYVRHEGKWTNLAKLIRLKVHSVPRVLPADLPEVGE